jgi:excinuclease ABC subunit A
VKELIRVRGARQHNLKRVDVDLPRNSLVVVTGPSGSGKSSLAFDTIFAEGQRRYVESLDPYARQFLGQMPKPEVDAIEGLSPAIGIHHSGAARNPRSTVGTATEIYDFVRLLYARVGRPHCPRCGRLIESRTVQQMVDEVLVRPAGSRFSVLAPLVRGGRGAFKRELEALQGKGFVRVRVDGELMEIGARPPLDRNATHFIDVYIDRLSVKPDIRQRLTESIELALGLCQGLVRIAFEGGEECLMSERLSCIECGVSLPEITPRLFSFNHPEGACRSCSGLGQRQNFDPALVIADPTLSLQGGAIAPWGAADGVYYREMLQKLRAGTGIDPTVPWKDLPEPERRRVLFGTRTASRSGARARRGAAAGRGFEGVVAGLERRRQQADERRAKADADEFDFLEEELGHYTTFDTCAACSGARLGPEALSVRVGGLNAGELTALSVDRARALLQALEFPAREAAVAEPILREIDKRLGFIADLGLGYRGTTTLSAGESERINLANQIGTGLTGVLYVLDEPSIGLHPRDNSRLIEALHALRDRGNTVLVVEHDAATIRAADFVVDMGPGAGRAGGEVVASGTPAEITRQPASLTGRFLSGARRILPSLRRRPEGKRRIVVSGARVHNLADVSASFPLGRLICVTGVSGSGKSSLVMDTLLRAARQRTNAGRETRVEAKVSGLEYIDKVIHIDQTPIGRTARSVPATYTGVFALIRELFAELPEARARGYNAARFSFNVKGGRCEACQGAGILKVEMHFLPDIYVRCEVCGGRRYNRETVEITYRGKSIADLLGTTVDDAYELLGALPKIRDALASLRRVGLGYLELGQSATTLSRGEAQRLKLSRELSRRSTGRTLYILDEPTTGLHFGDVEFLMNVLEELVDAGNTAVVIEHNLDVIRLADYLIDMGPDGGPDGGRVVSCGTPEQVAGCPGSHTGRFLKREGLGVDRS